MLRRIVGARSLQKEMIETRGGCPAPGAAVGAGATNAFSLSESIPVVIYVDR